MLGGTGKRGGVGLGNWPVNPFGCLVTVNVIAGSPSSLIQNNPYFLYILELKTNYGIDLSGTAQHWAIFFFNGIR